MTSRITTIQSDDADRCDILSNDEERALCLIRQIVAGIRARDLLVYIEAVEQELIDAGSSKLGDAAEREPSMFRLHGAHFSLTAGPQPGAGIEINFHPVQL